MLNAYKESGGLTAATNAPSVKTKQALCKLHLNEHAIEGNIGGAFGIRVSTARQYQLIKSFDLKAARPLTAEREGLPISTISRSLFLAREDGILQKMSDVEDIYSLLSKGPVCPSKSIIFQESSSCHLAHGRRVCSMQMVKKQKTFKVKMMIVLGR